MKNRILTWAMMALVFPFQQGFADDHEVYRAIAMEVASRIKLQIPVGVIMPFAGSQRLPAGYLECNGQSLPKSPANAGDPDYRTLYATIGDEFTPENERGGSTFRVPDLQGRVPLGAGAGSGLTERKLGSQLGEEKQKLTADQSGVPAHSHPASSGDNDKEHSHQFGLGTKVQAGGNSGQSVYHPNYGKEMGWTGPENAKHRHAITVEDNKPRDAAKSFSKIQPSLVVRYIIRWKGETFGATDEADVRQTLRNDRAVQSVQSSSEEPEANKNAVSTVKTATLSK